MDQIMSGILDPRILTFWKSLLLLYPYMFEHDLVSTKAQIEFSMPPFLRIFVCFSLSLTVWLWSRTLSQHLLQKKTFPVGRWVAGFMDTITQHNG